MHQVRRIVSALAGSIITELLALAFLVSCFLLGWHAWTAPKFDYNVAGELLLVAVLSLEGIVAFRHLRQARLDSVHQVLVSVLQDYRSPEMLWAMNSLWRFRREHGDKFVQDYLERWQKDDERIAGLPDDQQLAATAATLHCRRRIVKEFYNLLAGLRDLRVLPPEVLYTYWNEAELKIIPEILIPLEMAVAQRLRSEAELGGWFTRLRRLHDEGGKNGGVAE
jgi:hypothetical protein